MDESTAKSSPRRRSRLRRILKRVFYLTVILIGALVVYAWVTGARQEPIETGEPHMKAVVYTDLRVAGRSRDQGHKKADA